MHPTDSDLEEQLKQTQLAYEMAHQMCQFKSGFLARISHELRSPLNSLIGVHQLILADLCDDPAEERELIAQAHASALKLVHLLDQILEVAKVEHGTSQLQIQPLQLTSLLERVYQLTYLQAQNRNLHLKILSPDPQVYILADPHWLNQVLVNFIDTSISLMQEGTISLSVQIDSTIPCVNIRIEHDLPHRLWSEPSDLLLSSSPAITQDNDLPVPGLTLLMNQALLEQMQGYIEVLEVADHTCIQCSIPLVVPEAE